MTFSELTELQEQSRNAAHTITISQRVETNGWNQLDHSRRWIAAGNGSRQEMDRGPKWIAAGDGSRPEWHCGRRWMTGDGSQEMDHGRRMTMNLLPFYEDIQAMRSYTILEITTLNSNYEV
jgi:hypothetical protein